MIETIIICAALMLVCGGVVLYTVLRPTGGKANKSIFDVGYNHMADDAPQIPDENEANEEETEETPVENAENAEQSGENEA